MKAGEPLATLGLKNLKVTADDQAFLGQKTELLACKDLDVSISKPIVAGKPIVIDKLVLIDPKVAAIAAAPGSAFAGRRRSTSKR